MPCITVLCTVLCVTVCCYVSLYVFLQEDLLKKSEELLKAIDTGDYASYSKLCDEALTCFEPESQGADRLSVRGAGAWNQGNL